MRTPQKQLLFIYTETPLHAGSGRSLGAVDLPIQRERTTDYPIVQSSSLKGCLRDTVRFSASKGEYWEYKKDKDGQETKEIEDTAKLKVLFGSADGDDKSYAGAIAPGDARTLLFPVRSLQGVFAWVTSLDVLNRFQRDATAMGISLDWQLSTEPETNEDSTECWAGKAVTSNNNQVTLEEFTYTAKSDPVIENIGRWLSQNALPQQQTAPEYEYWRDHLSDHLVILRREDFRDFARYGTEVRTHIKIAPDTKTVDSGALWTVESLPTDTLLYAPLIISDSRAQVDERQTAAEITQTLCSVLHDKRVQLGGDETTGYGVVMVHLHPAEEVKNG